MVAQVTRRGLFLAAVGLLAGRSVVVKAAGIHVTGTLSATDVEAREGYFALGRELSIVTKPGSPIHDDLQAMVGHECQVSVFTV